MYDEVRISRFAKIEKLALLRGPVSGFQSRWGRLGSILIINLINQQLIIHAHTPSISAKKIMGKFSQPRICNCGKAYTETKGWSKHAKLCKHCLSQLY